MKAVKNRFHYSLVIALFILPQLIFANEPPVARDISKTLLEDKSVVIILKGFDSDRDKLSYIISQQPEHGTVILDGNKAKYQPETNYFGLDEFQYKATDSMTESVPTSVTLTIKSVDDAPVVQPQNISASFDAVTTINLLAYDVECDWITYSIVKKPKNGTAYIYGSTLTYWPDHGFRSSDNIKIKAKAGKKSSKAVVVFLALDMSGPISRSFIDETATSLINGGICPFSKLNDTGQVKCSDYAFYHSGKSTGNLVCNGVDPQGDPIPPGQDAVYGRDAASYDQDHDGRVGFSFTKLDSSGNPLSALATEWDCVKDNVTGLVWENKTNSGLRSRDNTYSWYNPDNNSNGGYAGYQNQGTCKGSACDTYSYAQMVNDQGLCGKNDWRIPSRQELHSIVGIGDDRFLPSPPLINQRFWTSSPYAPNNMLAWIVNFSDKIIYFENKEGGPYKAYAIRLVRGGE